MSRPDLPAPDDPPASDLPADDVSSAQIRPPGEPVADADIVTARVVEPPSQHALDQNTATVARPARRRRRVKLPLILFLLTCISTFLVGATYWVPTYYLGLSLQNANFMPFRQSIVANWDDGVVYMICLLAILFMHEMGHFVATLYYRIPASLPYFLPLPITPIGTLGAVIGMDGRLANRKEIFDIGLAGPVAGLLVAVPVMWMGVEQLDLTQQGRGGLGLDMPLLVRWMLAHKGYTPDVEVWIGHLKGNPYFMAGWVGLLLTGLNMLPVSQLDGGHVTYTLFGRAAHWIARAFMLAVVLYIVWDFQEAYKWSLMVLLVFFIGTDHPPTRDDNVSIGWLRAVLGFVSLAIPILCLPPRVFY